MRIIKFRCWDKKLNIMWEPIEMKKLISYLIFQQMPNATAVLEIKDHFPEIVWEQFTGLYDKNGQEVYEGDVVVWHINGRHIKAPVYYDEQGACFWMGEEIKPDGTGMGLVVNDWLRGEYEVVGNIHCGKK